MKVYTSFSLFFTYITWGIVQTILGALLTLFLLPRARVRIYCGMIVVYHKYSFTFSLGTFAFVSDRCEFPRKAVGRMYGFYVQSIFYGPLFLFAVILPQLIVRISPIKRYRAERGIAPTDLFSDRQAARLQARYRE